jgi:hypothetical protein
VRYILQTVIGLTLLVGAIVAISYGVYQLLQVGTCASGGPYEIARECPEGTEWLGLAIPIGIFVMLGAAALYATAGPPPGSDKSTGQGGLAILILWSGLFLGIGFACFWGVWGPNANPGPGGELGGLIVGFLFIPMGLLGAIPMWSVAKSASATKEATGIGVGDTLKMARKARKTDYGDLVKQMQEQAAAQGAGSMRVADEPPAGEAVVASGGDVVSKLERLQALRESGAIDDAEFERLKAQVM